MSTSIGSGLPTRNASSLKIHGTYRLEIATAAASSQSMSGMPPGRAKVDGNDPGLIGFARGEHQKDQAEHEGHVDAAMRGLAQQAETGGVVVEGGEHQEQARNDPGRAGAEGPEAHLGIELLLECPAIRNGGEIDGIHETLIGTLPEQARVASRSERAHLSRLGRERLNLGACDDQAFVMPASL